MLMVTPTTQTPKKSWETMMGKFLASNLDYEILIKNK